MATKEKGLNEAFHETLKDVYFAEKQSVKALKKSAKAAKAPELKAAFDRHHEESTNQLERLVQVFEIIGKPARAKPARPCRASPLRWKRIWKNSGKPKQATPF